MTKPRILCVDDHRETCELIGRILGDYAICSVHTKTEGIRVATCERFDLYLLDYYLPDGTGLELSRLIRVVDSAGPILIVTGTRMIRAEQLESAGVQGIVYKSDLLTTLFQRVSQLLPGVSDGQTVAAQAGSL